MNSASDSDLLAPMTLSLVRTSPYPVSPERLRFHEERTDISSSLPENICSVAVPAGVTAMTCGCQGDRALKTDQLPRQPRVQRGRPVDTEEKHTSTPVTHKCLA